MHTSLPTRTQHLRAPASTWRAIAVALAFWALLWSSLPAAARSPQARPTPPPPPAGAVGTSCPQDQSPVPGPEQWAALRKQSHPDRGVLWELRKGEQQAYLLGTIHLGQPAWIFPGPQTQQAIDKASAIALELDPLDANNAQQLAQYMLRDSDVQQLILRNNPQILERMQQTATRLCVAGPQFQPLGAIGKILTLAMVDSVGAGYSPLYGVDLVLATMARQSGKPLLALETVQEQISALGLGSNKLADSATPADFAKALDDIDSGKGRQMLQQLASHWQRGDLAALKTLMDTCQCLDDIGMKANLLDERNARMAERIPALLDQHPRLFIAVGMLHMVGEHNLLELLQQQGFVARQLTGVGAQP